jgi:hypothetical protein
MQPTSQFFLTMFLCQGAAASYGVFEGMLGTAHDFLGHAATHLPQAVHFEANNLGKSVLHNNCIKRAGLTQLPCPHKP